MSWLDPYKWLISLALVALLAAGGWFAWWHHGNVRYDAGMAYVHDVDAKALATAQKAADAKTAQLLAQSNKAHQEAANAIQKYDDYVARVALEPVRVRIRACIGSPVSGPSAAKAGTTDPGPAPGTSAPVLDRGDAQGLDLTPELGTILQGFAYVDIGLQESQQRAVK